ncbi:UDP-N-acetylglucosamine--LPS N-acetylglucosamine transferase [Histidinibacterium lentulum]|uniref:UDP-N-acetylglucosamine--LPS N-acetylglucosamine transferase n=1 Tax=Histidinibacterium lentulum TaxID=2480588 RepID=A0A3N2RAF7_9RHOB|nr:UDP-N-acetylglucosamine--LPS N-acetylglucosamine transferase [Histidinibacterium lentulum]ROU04336.1 UDP-N-acetylglucosamine--LPS N-acetylglucosamine transferase [Histidinibacterium lentulum]
MPVPSRSRPVVLAVSSGGGHWVQMQRLTSAFEGAEVHYATTDPTVSEQIGAGEVHVYPDANKTTPVRLALCIARLAIIVLRVRPDVIVSTGAAGGVIAIRLGRLIGARTLFIDSIANARELSVSARLALGVADRVLSQWPAVAEHTGADYRGAVL